MFLSGNTLWGREEVFIGGENVGGQSRKGHESILELIDSAGDLAFWAGSGVLFFFGLAQLWVIIINNNNLVSNRN